MKYILLLFLFISLQTPKHDLTEILSNMQGGWSVGNACLVSNFMDNEVNGSMEMNGYTLEVLYAKITIKGTITNFAEVKTVQELIDSGQIVLKCDAASVVLDP